MTFVEDLTQLVVRVAVGVAASLAAGAVTYVMGVWLLKAVVSLALQAPAP